MSTLCISRAKTNTFMRATSRGAKLVSNKDAWRNLLSRTDNNDINGKS